MKKEVSNKLYLDIHPKFESKERFIEKVITRYQKELLEGNLQPGGSSLWADATTEQVTVTFAEKVKEFEAIEHKNQQVNIVVGSSKVAELESHSYWPCIQAYRLSTTKEQL